MTAQPDENAPTPLPVAAPLPPPISICGICGTSGEASSFPFHGEDVYGLAICANCMDTMSQPELRRMLRVMIQNFQIARDSGFTPANRDNEKILDRQGQKIKKIYGYEG